MHRDNMSPQLTDVSRAALSEVCFMLASKLKLACVPMGTLDATLMSASSTGCSTGHPSTRRDEPETSSALQQLLQLEGMTPRRAVALRAAQICTCSDLVNAPTYDIFKVSRCTLPLNMLLLSADLLTEELSGRCLFIRL